MKIPAWIARDEDGEATLFIEEEPAWTGSYWSGDRFDEWTDSAEAIASGLALPPSHKQSIELTARPVGEAVRGGE